MIYQYFIAAIALLIPSLCGIALVAWTRIFHEKVSIASVGSILGMAMFGTVSYALGHIIPLTTPVVWTEIALIAGIAIWVGISGGIRQFTHARTDRSALLLGCTFLVLFSIIGTKLLIERPDGLHTGIINAYGDIGWHAAMIMNLTSGSLLPAEDPIFAGHALTYPFLANLLSAIMIQMGSSLPASMNVPAILLIPLLLVLIYIFASQYANTKTAGVVTCLLFLFGGATLGFIRFPQDLAESGGGIGSFLLNLPARDYSGVGTDEQGFHFLNPITSLLLPQRAILFGIPLVLSVLLLLHPENIRKPYAPLLAGVLAGMLPLFHAHACISLAIAIIALFIASPEKRRFLWFAIPALVIGIPELTFYVSGEGESGSFFRYGPGWMSGEKNHILYWLQNTGLYIPVSIIALMRKTPRPAKALTLAGSGIFILADTFLFAPWAWDNFKLFVFWLLFILPSIGYISSRLIHRPHHVLVPTLACTMLLLHIISASLDIWKLALPTARVWGEWTREAMDMATLIRKNVPIGTPVATTSVHNSPAALSGRTLFLGYAAHIWSHGALPWDRERDMKEYFEGRGDTIEGVSPQYILVGPQERSSYPKLFIRPTWKQVASHGPYLLFKNPS